MVTYPQSHIYTITLLDWSQDTMRFVTQAHFAGAPMLERWSANGYTLHLTACASARACYMQCALPRVITAFLLFANAFQLSNTDFMRMV